MSTSLRTRRPLLALVTTTVLLASLSACGSSVETDSSAGGAVPSSGAASEPPSSSPVVGDAEFSGARDAYDLTLAQCLRDKGFQVADPVPGEGIQETSVEINEAALECMDEIGDPPAAESAMSDTEMLAVWLDEAECFRDLGFEVEEPALNLAYSVPADATPDQVASCISAMP